MLPRAVVFQSGIRSLPVSRSFRLALILGISTPALLAADPEKVDFTRDIRPILSDNCFRCHGPDTEARQGELRLDLRENALAPAGSGERPIVPKQVDESELIRRIESEEEGFRMPPLKGGKKPLSKSQIELLKKWIEQGADYTSHWAFTPPVRPKVPAIQGLVKNPIDAFILEKLSAAGLKPSPEAERVTLVRRLYLDLIGLPPTIQEVEEFLGDNSPDSYEKLVERLLASPHYGERWARPWLDAARYADSDGFEKDKSRNVHFYRDYVIQALNKDLPYNQFVVEQLAGDLLPNPTQDQLVATGFLRNSMLNEEGGVDPEQFRMDAMFDRMDAIGKTFLGLTIQCSQCHTHKYDPITQEEYYRLFAFLNNDHESQMVAYDPSEQAQIAMRREQMRAIETKIQEKIPDWSAKLNSWEQSVSENLALWTVVSISHLGDNAQRYFDQEDGSILAQGYAPTKFTAQFAGKVSEKKITAIRLELLNDPNLPCNGPGRSSMGTSALSEISVEATESGNPANKVTPKIVRAIADYGNPERPLEPMFDDKSNKKRVTGPVEFAFDGNDDTAWGIDAGPGRRNQPRHAIFVFDKPIEFAAGVELVVSLKQNHGGWNSDDHMNNNLGRFRISVTSSESGFDPLPARVRSALGVDPDKRSPEQSRTIFNQWRTSVAELEDENKQYDALWAQWPAGSTSLVLAKRDSDRVTSLLARGDFLKPVRQVNWGVPSFLHELADTGVMPPRLRFAQWVADRRNPTLARVFINRIWQSYFGTGLVSTPEDFGTQGDSPSHPELLDWLAVEFTERDYSIKHMHRLIVTSNTYRQSSVVNPDDLAIDPTNRLLGRFPRLRIDAELVRDVSLASSGLLNRKLNGPSIYSPAPGFLFQPPASYGPFNWIEERGPNRYRRAIYTFRRRSTPYPMLQAFDAPNGDFSCVKRARSNTPLQALTALNETLFLEAARNLALETLQKAGKSDQDKIVHAFRRCVARTPDEQELKELNTLLDDQRTYYKQAKANPLDLLTNEHGEILPIPESITKEELASWTIVSRVLLNLDETITRE